MRRPNHRLVKVHRTYTVEEAARLLGVHRNSVRQWIKSGLSVVDSTRPVLIQGADLQAFLAARIARNKRTLKPGEIYCVKCREPRRPDGGLVEFRASTPELGSLVGMCPTCQGLIYRRVATRLLAPVLGDLALLSAKPPSHIGETTSPIVNSDFGG